MQIDRDSRRARLRGALAGGERTYAGADIANARRLLGLLGLFSTLLVIVYLPLDPPSWALGAGGWLVAAALVAGGIAIPLALLRGRYRPGFDALLAYGYAGLAQVAVLEWLAGGAGSAYSELFLFWVVAGAGLHPPRRALPFLVVTPLVSALPLLYAGRTSATVADIVAPALVWLLAGVLVMVLMTAVRAQRVRAASERRQAEGLARSDELTGLANRRALQEDLEAEIARTRRARSPLSLAMLDLDDFKVVNDHYGHLEGDRCLRQIGDALADAIRTADRCYRWGGDEFAILMPDTPHEEAQGAVERIAVRLSSACRRPDGLAQLVSFGVSELRPEQKPQDLLGAADLALMTHKSSRGVERL